MARSDNTADGRLEAEPEGTRSCRPHAASLRLHDPSTSGSRSPSLLACSQHAQRRGLDSLPNRLGDRKTNTTIAPASGIGGTTAQSFQYNGLSQTTFARDTAQGNNADVTIVYDSIGRTVEEVQTYSGNTRYVTNDAFTSLPVSQFTYPNSRQINNSFDNLYRRQLIVEAATSAVIASWQYFGANRIATVTLGNGLVCSNMNNAQARSAIQSGLPTPAWGSIATDQLGYDGAGRMIGKRFINGTNVTVGFTSAYDKSSDKLFERPLHAEERSSLYDSYDSMNRLLDYQRGILATGGGSVTTPVALPGTDQGRSYNLDALGNWTSSVYTSEGATSAITDQRNHNKLNEIIQRTVGSGPAVTFQYDGVSGASNGNLANDGTLIYFYDAFNRPIELRVASYGGVIAVYAYDALNRRVRKNIGSGGLPGNVPNGTTDYIYMGNQVAEESNPFGGTGSTDTPIRQYVWGTYPGAAALTRPLASTGFRQQNTGLGSLNIDECIQLTTLEPLGPQSLPAGAYYPLQDLLYRAVALTNSSGGIVETNDTDAYGNTIIFTGPGADGIWFTDDDVQSSYGANDIIYCGYPDNKRVSTDIGTGLNDPETELYYVRNRSYNSIPGKVLRQEPKSRQATGVATRVLQRDPIGYAGDVNLYEYVGGRAVVSADGTGLVESYLWHGGIPLDVPEIVGRGAPVNMGRGPDGKCRFYRNYYYKEFLGTIYNGGSRTFSGLGEELVNAAVRGVANRAPVTRLVSLWTSDLTASSATFIWDAYGTFEKTMVFTYTCCTDYKNIEYESTTLKNGVLSLVAANLSAADVNNVAYPQSGVNARKRAAETILEAMKGFIDTLSEEK